MNNAFWKNKKVLITGHTGFKGSWLTYLMLKQNAEVVGYALSPPTEPNLFSILGLERKIRNYAGDIRDFDKLNAVVSSEKPDIVFHLAAQPILRRSYDEPLLTYSTNVMGTANILQSIRQNNSVKSAVMITTDKVYKNKEWPWGYRENDELGGHDPYSASKVCAEFVINSYARSFFEPKDCDEMHNTCIASTRAGNVIGGGDWAKDRLVPDIVRAILQDKKTITLRCPGAIRPWQHVLDPIFGYALLAEKLYAGEKNLSGSWNFAPDDSNHISVEDITKRAINYFDAGKYEIVPELSKHETQYLFLNSSKAKSLLKWHPVIDIDSALDCTFGWYKAYHDGENMIAVMDKQITAFFEKWEKTKF